MEATLNATNPPAMDCNNSRLPTSTIIICASLLVLAIFILAANLTVVVLVALRASLRTQTNVCLSSLAASDFLAGFLALPLTIACSSTTCVIPQLCLSMDLCQRFLAISTIIHLLVITTERYTMIVHPLWYPRILTKSRIFAVLVSTWLISLFISLIQLAWYDPEWKEVLVPNNDLIYDIFCVAVIVLLPLAFMIYANIHILVVARQQIKTIKRQTNHLRSANQRTEKTKVQLVYVAMIGVFIMGWIPYFLFAIEADSNQALFVSPSWLQDILIFFKFFTALFNPLLYTYFKSDFKKEMLLLYRRMRRCCTAVFLRETNTQTDNSTTRITLNENTTDPASEETLETVQRVTVV